VRREERADHRNEDDDAARKQADLRRAQAREAECAKGAGRPLEGHARHG
jgi:hypothetical protein